MKLLELDYLGGCGSRGYGRIKFHFDDEKIKQKFESITLF
jgi:CRISPR-associated protein Csm3